AGGGIRPRGNRTGAFDRRSAGSGVGAGGPHREHTGSGANLDFRGPRGGGASGRHDPGERAVRDAVRCRRKSRGSDLESTRRLLDLQILSRRVTPADETTYRKPLDTEIEFTYKDRAVTFRRPNPGGSGRLTDR